MTNSDNSDAYEGSEEGVSQDKPLNGLKSGFLLRARAFRDYSTTSIPRHNHWKFIGAAFVVGIVALIAFPKSQAEAEAHVEVPLPTAPTVDLTRFDFALDETLNPTPVARKTLVVKSGDSLGPLLQNNGLTGVEAYRITQAFADVYQPRNVRVGQTFDLFFKGEKFENMTFRPSVEKTVFVERNEEGFEARELVAEFKYETLAVKATIENSLYLDATRLGAPDKVVAQFANIYEYSVDFQRDIQPGDEFEMFFEVAKDRKGNIIKAGDLLYTSFAPRGKTMEYYLYEDKKGRENFYDADGKTAKRKLRATPINGARLSSSFGRRKHPILGYRKMHAGVDYAHLSKFARGVRAGAYVKQDQVIGYVGTTGRSTGPHLHYEVHLNGKKINPRRLSQLSGKPLAKSEKPAFAKRRAEIDALRETSETIMPLASTTGLQDIAP